MDFFRLDYERSAKVLAYFSMTRLGSLIRESTTLATFQVRNHLGHGSLEWLIIEFPNSLSKEKLPKIGRKSVIMPNCTFMPK